MEHLRQRGMNDIWGVGGQYALLLRRNGFKAALDVKNAPADFMRKEMTSGFDREFLNYNNFLIN